MLFWIWMGMNWNGARGEWDRKRMNLLTEAQIHSLHWPHSAMLCYSFNLFDVRSHFCLKLVRRSWCNFFLFHVIFKLHWDLTNINNKNHNDESVNETRERKCVENKQLVSSWTRRNICISLLYGVFLYCVCTITHTDMPSITKRNLLL